MNSRFFCLFFCLFSLLSYADTSVKANKILVKYDKQLFFFSGNVQMELDDIKILSHYLNYNNLDKHILAYGQLNLFLPKDQIQIIGDKLVKSGDIIEIDNKIDDVEFKDLSNDRTILSEKIIISDQEKNYKTINFSGNPKLEDNNIIASSDKNIIFNQKNSMTQFLGNVKIEDKKTQSIIQSQNMDFLEKKQTLIFNNFVTMVDEQNHFLSGGKGSYLLEDEFIFLEKKVEYIADIVHIYSNILKTDKIFDKQTQTEDIIYLFEQEPRFDYQSFKGNSKKIFVNKSKNYIELVDNVTLKSDNGLIITCDVMTVLEKEKKAYLYNNVKIVDNNRTLTSDVATYDDKTKIFTLRGNAKYTQNNTMYSSQVIYLNSADLSVKFVGQVRGQSNLAGLKGIEVDNL